MEFQNAIKKIIENKPLTAEEMTQAMRTLMTGQATPAQIGGFLVGLRMRGETVTEISAAAGVMRELSTRVSVSPEHLVDTCGTGGDSSGTFNISTASAFVAAAAGARVAKHGNRSVSSKSGSADVLEAAGIHLGISPEQVAHCIDHVGVGFLFAQLHHSAMKHAIGPRRELGVRTIFNLLGPLTNPAGAPHQVLGVFSQQWVRPMAEVLQTLGSQHVMVVHAADGLDEISIASPTFVAELKDDAIHEYSICPEDFGLSTTSLDSIRVTTAQESLALIRQVLAGETGAARDIVCLNAGAAIYVAGLAASHAEGIAKAQQAIDSGAAAQRLQQLSDLTNSFKA
ncbi:MAG TPA: anthranilate phosphoribosyltransferase [Candidatus Thiothrix moscowensis]|uniref:anthranilate phosphoribosyltransferase n=1 Tax=unclassified Thiothrix TaxID=2636184 RepID=UPI0025F77CA6|nr:MULTISPECIES: anthranilate phosphoribosyltransferase [unclassified Thiothrix]HRJ52040.1 anthranilate phosphoribosyltransferase [Candidatus Thiothrix moscowensis]HRJ92449.1 anthranilate phosphoribosyltransferase [Candidatus Thiothrix moscowensis]